MIDGFSIAGYRSFGQNEVRIANLSQFNIFIGKNNCGKSNILRFLKGIAMALKEPRGSSRPSLQLDQSLDFCLGEAKRIVSFGLQLKKDGFTKVHYKQIESQFHAASPDFAGRLAEDLWFHYDRGVNGVLTPSHFDEWVTFLRKRFSGREPNRLAEHFGNFRSEDPAKCFAHIAMRMHEMTAMAFDVHVIDAFRRVSTDGDDKLCGAGLIKELRKLQSPEYKGYQPSRDRFKRIGDFLRSVLGEPSARLEIPAESDDIYVVINDKTLPLASLGTGIHEIVILSAAVTLIDNSIFCIEEPEIHCHPELQRKFIRYLAESTKNQYLIASHSSAILDLPGTNTYRCWLNEEGCSQCELAASASDKHALLLDLGYKPSDLLQANYVIWVEGPSDRIYLNHWIKQKAPDLLDGLHYTVMFYGGRLLSHLCYDEPAVIEESVVADFVHLARLNRSTCIVIDSDRDKADDQLNDTKMRIQTDFEANECLVWITAGRTIENYASEELLNSAVASVHPKTKAPMKWEAFADLTKIAEGRPMNKVAVARRIAEQPADFSTLDLGNRVDVLIDRIRRYNREPIALDAVIVADPEILNGTPCFRGTRVPFKNLIDHIEGGHSLREFLDEFPSVTREMAVQALEDAKQSFLGGIA